MARHLQRQPTVALLVAALVAEDEGTAEVAIIKATWRPNRLTNRMATISSRRSSSSPKDTGTANLNRMATAKRPTGIAAEMENERSAIKERTVSASS